MDNEENFYKNISKNFLPLTKLLKDERLFFDVPKSWYVVVTDIENSTEAVAKGLHNDVNLSATGSIVTVLNTLKEVNSKIKIPYFFGGDGSTFMIPQIVLEPILLALNNYSQHIAKTTQLNLRVGQLSVEKVYENGCSLKITKLRQNEIFTTPVVIGNGIKYAERVIKERFVASEILNEESVKLNLTGMECRWEEIYPNKTDKKVICLLVDCDDEKTQAEVYGDIMKKIDLIFGDLDIRNPISAIKLKLNTSIEKIRKEMYAKIGKHQNTYLISNWLITKIGNFYFKFFKSGKLYKQRVSQLSDTIMLDGFLNTVISGTDEQINKLKAVLNDLESQEKIIYGIHITHASIMSCYIEDREEKHVHFVDGTEGGYTSAAIMFKDKLKKLQLRST
jgi:hypothetical protein